jgi:hypothetical protein
MDRQSGFQTAPGRESQRTAAEVKIDLTKTLHRLLTDKRVIFTGALILAALGIWKG